MKRITLVSLSALVLTGIVMTAQPPDRINYQGVLRNSADEPLDGSFPMTFRFFDDPTEGNELLVDTHAAVTVTGGLFNVEIGSGSVADGSDPGTFSTLADVFGQYTDLYLEVEVNGETLLPRTAVSAAGYALNARKVRGRELVSEGPLELYVDGSVTGCGGGGCSDVNDGLSLETAKQTIQAAVDAIPAVLNGAVTVNITPGSYVGAITLGQRLRNGPYPVWLKGNDAAPSSVTIQGDGRDGEDTGISVFDDSVLISGMTVSQFGLDQWDDGLSVRRRHRCGQGYRRAVGLRSFRQRVWRNLAHGSIRRRPGLHDPGQLRHHAGPGAGLRNRRVRKGNS
jgi:hypothetical protein